jgi:di/tricarboxylate transporter
MNRTAGLVLVLIGLGIVVVGLLAWSGALSWFGRLPGDIRVEGERSRVYVPLVSMLVVSVVLTVIVNVIGRFLR